MTAPSTAKKKNKNEGNIFANRAYFCGSLVKSTVSDRLSPFLPDTQHVDKPIA
jgi:hypothetical protein